MFDVMSLARSTIELDAGAIYLNSYYGRAVSEICFRDNDLVWC